MSGTAASTDMRRAPGTAAARESLRDAAAMPHASARTQATGLVPAGARVHIEHLVVDGLPLGARDARRLRDRLAFDLGQALADAELRRDSAERLRLPVPALQADAGVEDVCRALGQGLRQALRQDRGR